ncbi:Conserved hypothetical protein [Synechococcus sp. WH 7803]|nr:Conserved hypothetical protein [Synechococcus sp. WH 7803]
MQKGRPPREQHGEMHSSKPSVSWVLAARDPHKLANFYAGLLQTEAQTGLADHHWIVPLPSGGSLQIYTPSRHRPWPASGAVLAPCLQRVTCHNPLEDLRCWRAEVLAMGGSSPEEPRQESFGAECWLTDPEGQRFLLLVTQAKEPTEEAM